MLTLIGQIATPRGDSQQFDRAGGVDPFTLPASGFLQCQPKVLPVYLDHDETWQLGQVQYLERSAPTGLLVVATIDADIADMLDEHAPWQLSAGVRTVPTGVMEHGYGKLSEVSLVRKSAMLNEQPVRFSRSNIVTDAGGAPHGMPLRWHDTWRRAHLLASSYKYQRSTEHVIVDVEAIGRPAPVATRAEPVVFEEQVRRRTFGTVLSFT